MTQENAHPIRILIAKVGLCGHDRGAKYVAKAFRDAGFEVIYTGIRQTPEDIVNIAIQEDVEAIGVSIHSGAHNTLLPKIAKLLQEKDYGNILFVAGGVIPADDIKFLKENGVAEIFTPGASSEDFIDFVKEKVKIHED